MSEVGTMKICGVGCVIKGKEGRTPPLPFITVSESEGNALIAQKLAVEVTGVAAEAAPEPTPAPAPAKPKRGQKAPAASTEPEKAPEATTEPEKAPEVDAERVATIVEALDLVEGEPTVEAVADITGLADVTAEEIEAAKAAKDAAE